ncbi:MAG: hypothetical protein SH847_04730 [Roseiflexaceae bacterium]|nr:hypothetical protein [Roseiflexaceae bacterium]
MAPRFSRPRLIDDQDRQYRAFLSQIMLSRQNHKAIRPPRARDLFGGEAEIALRGWLGERIPLTDRRIVEYLEHRGNSAIKKYRELDAVSIPEPKTLHVYEMKASQKATSLYRARRQLSDTRAILGPLFARVYITIMLVDTGIPKTPEEAEQQAALIGARYPDSDPPPPLPTLDEVLATAEDFKLIDSLDERDPDHRVICILRFSVDDIIALSGAENLHLEWDTEDDEEFEQEEPELERHTFSSSDASSDEEEESPLAAALRKAMEGRS